jgi:16S rRNA (guanine527-N7)-methyltransferase
MTSKEFAVRLERRVSKADVLMPSAQAVALLEVYYTVLSRWNTRINLTSLALDDAPPATLDRLLVEPLAAARYVPEGPIRWLDLGSGGGSPAIPLKIVRPEASLTMVEATTKKATFLKEVVRELHLADAEVENTRIESLASRDEIRETADLISARAVRLTAELFDAIRWLLKPDGQLHLYASRQPEIRASTGFSVEAAYKLGVGLETRLVVLTPVARQWKPQRREATGPSAPSRSALRVSRGTSPAKPVGAKKR